MQLALCSVIFTRSYMKHSKHGIGEEGVLCITEITPTCFKSLCVQGGTHLECALVCCLLHGALGCVYTV